jgi:hypothetical protein
VETCVYGGTASGVIATMQFPRLGRNALIVQPRNFLGGMTTGGLGRPDYGKQHVIGGIARQLYKDCGKFYGLDQDWRHLYCES